MYSPPYFKNLGLLDIISFNYHLDQKLNKTRWGDTFHFFNIYEVKNGYKGVEYRYGFQGQEADHEIKGEGNSVNYKYRMHDARIGRFFAVDPLAPDYPNYSPYQFSGNRLIDMIELEGLEPTESEATALANDVYEPSGEELEGGWNIIKEDDGTPIMISTEETGFKSAVYERVLPGGEMEYAYVTAGTDMTSTADCRHNLEQIISGTSEQYATSVNLALALDALYAESTLTFVGHSLGGGMASANALATGREAITFNAAGLSKKTKENLNLNKQAKITAYVVRGEIVDYMQSELGLKAEATKFIEIPHEKYYGEDTIFDKSGIQMAQRGIAHTMGKLVELLKEYRKIGTW